MLFMLLSRLKPSGGILAQIRDTKSCLFEETASGQIEYFEATCTEFLTYLPFVTLFLPSRFF